MLGASNRAWCTSGAFCRTWNASWLLQRPRANEIAQRTTAAPWRRRGPHSVRNRWRNFVPEGPARQLGHIVAKKMDAAIITPNHAPQSTPHKHKNCVTRHSRGTRSQLPFARGDGHLPSWHKQLHRESPRTIAAHPTSQEFLRERARACRSVRAEHRHAPTPNITTSSRSRCGVG